MVKLSKSQLVLHLAKKSFQECDLDKDGAIDAKELHVGLLLVYDKLNKSLPVHLQPPDHDTVQDLLRKYDADGTGHLDFEEFHECVRAVVGLNEKAKFTDSLPAMVLGRMALKMAIFPLAAVALKALLCQVHGAADKVPNGALVFGVEGLYKVAKVKLQR